MHLHQPEIFQRHPAVCCALSMRAGGNSPLDGNFSYHVGDREENVERARASFFGSLSLSPEDAAFPQQVHGSAVARADHPGMYDGCDALVTDRIGLSLGVLFADCVPLFMYDPASGAVAAVHAGWRGTASRVAVAAVRKLDEAFGAKPENLLVYIGPAAGSCCYAVGPEVASLFDEADLRRETGRIFLDLKQANARQLAGEGVLSRHVEISPFCTITDKEMFHSHRRDGRNSGRMMGVIALTGRVSAR